MSDIHILPEINALRECVYNVLLLDYMMMCYRVPPTHSLPHPPQRYSRNDQTTNESLLLLLDRTQRHLFDMLHDDIATPRERMLVESNVTLTHLRPWLSVLTFDMIVKMPSPSMTHADYVFMVKECSGRYSYNDAHCTFVGIEDMQRFKNYLNKKYQTN